MAEVKEKQSANPFWSPKTASPMSASPTTEPNRPVATSVRSTAWLGANIQIKGEVSGNEDLHVDGKIDGPISLGGHRLTVGRTAIVNADTVAREVIVYGKVAGNLRARDRIEIKKDGSVTGDLNTARIMIEEGAYFKGSIEIDSSQTQVGADLDTLLARGVNKTE